MKIGLDNSNLFGNNTYPKSIEDIPSQLNNHSSPGEAGSSLEMNFWSRKILECHSGSLVRVRGHFKRQMLSLSGRTTCHVLFKKRNRGDAPECRCPQCQRTKGGGWDRVASSITGGLHWFLWCKFVRGGVRTSGGCWVPIVEEHGE